MHHGERKWVHVYAIAAILGLASLSAQEQSGQTQGQQQQQQQQQPTMTATTATAGAIVDNPEVYYGKKVTVRAEVEDILGRQSFLLDEDRLFAWPDLLVITPMLAGMVPEDEDVTVTGTVQRFSMATIRRDYDWDWWSDWDPDVAMTFNDRPVLIADSIKAADGRELVKVK